MSQDSAASSAWQGGTQGGTQRFWDEDEDEDEEVEEPPSARLVRVEDGTDGEATPIPPHGVALVVGRKSSGEHSCNLVLEDRDKTPPVISSRHAILLQEAGVLKLRILSENSFTFVNESPFIAKNGEPEPVALHHGDVLRFGGGKKAAQRYEKFIFRVDAPGFPALSRQASLQPSPTPHAGPPPARCDSAEDAAGSSSGSAAAPESAPASASDAETAAAVAGPSAPAAPPAEPVWKWNSGGSNWSAYSDAVSKMIERAYQARRALWHLSPPTAAPLSPSHLQPAKPPSPTPSSSRPRRRSAASSRSSSTRSGRSTCPA